LWKKENWKRKRKRSLGFYWVFLELIGLRVSLVFLSNHTGSILSLFLLKLGTTQAPNHSGFKIVISRFIWFYYLYHRFYMLTYYYSSFITQFTSLSSNLGFTRAGLFVSFSSNYILPKVFFLRLSCHLKKLFDYYCYWFFYYLLKIK